MGSTRHPNEIRCCSRGQYLPLCSRVISIFSIRTICTESEAFLRCQATLSKMVSLTGNRNACRLRTPEPPRQAAQTNETLPAWPVALCTLHHAQDLRLSAFPPQNLLCAQFVHVLIPLYPSRQLPLSPHRKLCINPCMNM